MTDAIRIAQPALFDRRGYLRDVRAILASGRLMLGPYLARFEAEFAAACGTRYAVGVNSCTAALQLCLRYLKLAGREVIVPTNTFVATANAVLYENGKPVLADCDGSLCMPLTEVAERLNRRTAAVMLVHIAGHIAPDTRAIVAHCRRRGIPVIEDCAHAHGAARHGRAAGSFGWAGCYSFYPTKVLTTAGGGMLVTNDAQLAAFARRVRLHGAGPRGLTGVTDFGNDWYLDELRAALGCRQLPHLARVVAHRNRVAGWYNELLQGLPLAPVAPLPGETHAYYKYPVILDRAGDAAKLKRHFLRQHKLELESLYWPPVHLQPAYRTAFGCRRGMLPVSEALLARQVTLPMHAFVTRAQCARVATWLRDCLEGRRG
ncbi:MAG TPA: DegT/DnrJ/EryC1/StrS family aminotransferase [bacterium]|nr:DegT/DnrJ/EryC1/StrS family aminotransferase [bacterium]